MEKRKKFSVVKGGGNPSHKIDEDRDGIPERLYCNRCKAVGREPSGQYIDVSSSVYFQNNEVTTGVKKLACFDCMINGEKTFLTGC